MADRLGRSRRQFLLTGTGLGAGLIASGHALAIAAPQPKVEQDVSPVEDLMREHGVLNRILLIYDECLRRLRGNKDLEPSSLTIAAKIVRTFVEDYHEKLEENYLFPRFEKAGQLAGLVKVLREQHQAGRRVTDRIGELATPAGLKGAESSRTLSLSLQQFVRMYRPHESREDTVLFPALRGLMTAEQYGDLGKQFEEKEHQLFGEHGFANIVAQVAEIEKTLGIYDLS